MRSARFRLVSGIVGGLGLAAGLIAALTEPRLFFVGWLFGFVLWIGLALGALLLLMAHDLTGGIWGETLQAPLEAAVATMPIAAIAGLPLLPGLAQIYPWLQPAHAADAGNHLYLSQTFFLLRALCYFVIWLGFAALTLRPRPRLTSAPGLILAALAATFAAFDWTMSLEPKWNSTIYGLFVTVTEAEAALALATLAAVARERSRQRLNPLGSLLFAGVLLWAYLAFMQFLIIWEENLPDEISWYLARIADGWLWMTAAIALCGFALPFAILVWWPLKCRPVSLAAAAALLLLGYALTQSWLIFPALPGKLGWPAAAAFFGIGGVWLAVADWRLERGRLLPPRLVGHRHG
jgi:hypothetical protein